MRYIVLSVTALISMLLTGAVFTRVNIMGVAPDIILIMMSLMMLKEKTAAPGIYFIIGGILLDVLFSEAIGFYAIPYAVVSILISVLLLKRSFNDFLLPPLIMALYLVKTCVTALLSSVIRISFDFIAVFLRYTIWEALFTGAVAFVLMYFVNWLYRRQWMQPLKNG